MAPYLREVSPLAPDVADARRVVSLSGELWVLPEGTLYGGGPRVWRAPDAPPIHATPIRTLDAVLAEVGCIGVALNWARRHNLATLCEPVRRESGDGQPLMMDYVVWDAGMDFAQWRVFAQLYQIDLDEQTGAPIGTEQAVEGVERWHDFAGPMDFNDGGLTRVDHVTAEIAYGPVPGRCTCTGPGPRAGTVVTCELRSEPFLVEDEGYAVREQHIAHLDEPVFDLVFAGTDRSISDRTFAARPTEDQILATVAERAARLRRSTA